MNWDRISPFLSKRHGIGNNQQPKFQLKIDIMARIVEFPYNLKELWAPMPCGEVVTRRTRIIHTIVTPAGVTSVGRAPL